MESDKKRVSAFDAVLVPGGGVTNEGEPTGWVKPRLEAACRVPGEPWLVPLSAGTTHKPPMLSPRGFPITESKAGADYLVSLGCSPSRILLDTWSVDTIGNAYFARFVHCEPRGFQKILVITSAFHMPRTRLIFDWVFQVEPVRRAASVEYEEVADNGLAPSALEARIAKERAAIPELKKKIASIRTVEALHRFVFQEHGAYRYGVNRDAHPGSNEWLSSY